MAGKKTAGKGKIFKDPRYKLGKFIIDKFMDKREINLWRDLPTSYKLINKYPEERFWKIHLPCEFKIKNLSLLLLNKAAADKLKMFYSIYKNDLSIEKNIAIPKTVVYKLEDSNTGEDKIIKNKINSIYEFCKSDN